MTTFIFSDKYFNFWWGKWHSERMEVTRTKMRVQFIYTIVSTVFKKTSTQGIHEKIME